MPHCKGCDTNFSNRIYIDGKIKNVSSRKYCLKCSPFGKHNTRNPFTKGKLNCENCGITKDYGTKEYNEGDRGNLCRSCRQKKRRMDRNNKLLQLFGGKCQKCGYSKYKFALSFHHKDKSTKKFQLAGNITRKWEDVLKEAMKCKLLCLNCHAEEEYGNKQIGTY